MPGNVLALRFLAGAASYLFRDRIPASFGPAFQHWGLNVLLAIPLTVAFAAFSWGAVERPALSLRHYMERLDALSRWAEAGAARLLWARRVTPE